MHGAEQQFIAFGVAYIRNRRVHRAIDDIDQPQGSDRRSCRAKHRVLRESIDNGRMIDVTPNVVCKLAPLPIGALRDIAEQLQNALRCIALVRQHCPTDLRM